MRCFAIGLALLWCGLTSSVRAQERPRDIGESIDVWSEPNPGIRYLDRRMTTPCRVHAVVVQLDAPGIQVISTTHRQRWRTVSSFAEATHVQVAINGGFWALMQGARGLAAGGGAIWPNNGELDPELGELVIGREHDVRLVAPGEPIAPEAMEEISDAVSGRPWLVHQGALVTETLDGFETANDRAPRTAAGLSRDGHTLYLAVVDGRQPESRGMTLYEMGRLMAELGAYEAMNLDGGASSEMYVEELGGIVSIPSRGRWEIAVDDLIGEGQVVRETPHGREVLTRGREQEVINHIGILALAPPEIPVTAREGLDASLPAPPIPPPRPLPPRLSLGQLRETIARIVACGGPLAIVLAGGWLVRRWRKRRQRDAVA
jgi:hypothetical protein